MSEPGVKPIQAEPHERHWVVVSLGAHRDAAAVEVKHSSAHHKQNWRRLFRHPTEESASAECIRLATANPGKKFQVYASRFSCKVERETTEAAS